MLYDKISPIPHFTPDGLRSANKETLLKWLEEATAFRFSLCEPVMAEKLQSPQFAHFFRISEGGDFVFALSRDRRLYAYSQRYLDVFQEYEVRSFFLFHEDENEVKIILATLREKIFVEVVFDKKQKKFKNGRTIEANFFPRRFSTNFLDTRPKGKILVTASDTSIYELDTKTFQLSKRFTTPYVTGNIRRCSPDFFGDNKLVAWGNRGDLIVFEIGKEYLKEVKKIHIPHPIYTVHLADLDKSGVESIVVISIDGKILIYSLDFILINEINISETISVFNFSKLYPDDPTEYMVCGTHTQKVYIYNPDGSRREKIHLSEGNLTAINGFKKGTELHLLMGFSSGKILMAKRYNEKEANQNIRQIFQRLLELEAGEPFKEINLIYEIFQHKPALATFLLDRWFSLTNNAFGEKGAPLPKSFSGFFSGVLQPHKFGNDFHERLNLREQFFVKSAILSNKAKAYLLENFDTNRDHIDPQALSYLQNVNKDIGNKNLAGLAEYKAFAECCAPFYPPSQDENVLPPSRQNLVMLQKNQGFDRCGLFPLSSAPVAFYTLSNGAFLILDSSNTLKALSIDQIISKNVSECHLQPITIQNVLCITPLPPKSNFGDFAVLRQTGELDFFEVQGFGVFNKHFSFKLEGDIVFARGCQIGEYFHVIGTLSNEQLVHYKIPRPSKVSRIYTSKIKIEKPLDFPYRLTFISFIAETEEAVLGDRFGILFKISLKTGSLSLWDDIKIKRSAGRCLSVIGKRDAISFLFHNYFELFYLPAGEKEPVPVALPKSSGPVRFFLPIAGVPFLEEDHLFLVAGNILMAFSPVEKKIVATRSLPFNVIQIGHILPRQSGRPGVYLPVMGYSDMAADNSIGLHVFRYYPEYKDTTFYFSSATEEEMTYGATPFPVPGFRLPDMGEVAVICLAPRKRNEMIKHIEKMAYEEKKETANIFITDFLDKQTKKRLSRGNLVVLNLKGDPDKQGEQCRFLNATLDKKNDDYRIIVVTDLSVAIIKKELYPLHRVQFHDASISREELPRYIEKSFLGGTRYYSKNGLDEIYFLTRGYVTYIEELHRCLKGLQYINKETVQAAASKMETEQGVLGDIFGQMEGISAIYPLILFSIHFLTSDVSAEGLDVSTISQSFKIFEENVSNECINALQDMRVIYTSGDRVFLVPIWRCWLQNFPDPLKQFAQLIINGIYKKGFPITFITTVEREIFNQLPARYKLSSPYYQRDWQNYILLVNSWRKFNETDREGVKVAFRRFWQAIGHIVGIEQVGDANDQDGIIALELSLSGLKLPSTMNPKVYLIRKDTDVANLKKLIEDDQNKSFVDWFVFSDESKTREITSNLNKHTSSLKTFWFGEDKLKYLFSPDPRKKGKEYIMGNASLVYRSGYQTSGAIVPKIDTIVNKYSANRSGYQTSDAIEPMKNDLFFGRTAIISKLTGTHENQVIIGPRKIGKSSLLYQVKENLARFGKTPALVGCDGKASEQEIISTIFEAMKIRDDKCTYESMEKNLNAFEEPPVIILDEYDARIQWELFSIENGKEFGKEQSLSWRLRALAGQGKIRLILAGYYMVFLSLRETKHPFFNLFEEPIILGPLEEKEIHQLLTVPMERLGITYDGDALETLKKYTANIPYLAQWQARSILESLDKNEDLKKAGKITVDMVKQAVMQANGIISHLYGTISSAARRPIEELFFLDHMKSDVVTGEEIKIWLKKYDPYIRDDVFSDIVTEMMLAGVIFREPSQKNSYRVLSPEIRHLIVQSVNVEERYTIIYKNGNLFDLKDLDKRRVC